MKEAFVAKLEAQLNEWEQGLLSLKAKADQKLDTQALQEDWRAKRDNAVKKLEELKAEGSDRWDILKMGVESAWDELRTAFEAVTAKSGSREDLRSAKTGGDDQSTAKSN